MLYRFIEEFRDYLVKRGLSERHIERTCLSLKDFSLYLEEIGIQNVSGVTLKILQDYQREINSRISSRGTPYCAHTRGVHICSLRSFFRYLLDKNIVLANYAIHLKLPKVDRIPKNILSLSEVEALLSQPDLKTFKGLRDKAILEVFYSTGIRRMEMVNLNVYDVDLDQEILFIRQGKGAKDRVVPLGEWASFYLRKYLDEREKVAKSESALFVNARKRERMRIDYQVITIIVREYARRAGIEKKVGCHGLRHTCAVHFLEGGADVRAVQELLGHRYLETTQIYLTVSKEALKKAHRKSHPRGKLKPPGNTVQ